ncbi:hypothetical protein ACSLOR_28195, partial [Klebsiella pneumoniae]|uniref:hypothetical protein n=1 Tax=Klebsiella pneumoniae TaxID=573 RepID=UPI003EE34092
ECLAERAVEASFSDYRVRLPAFFSKIIRENMIKEIKNIRINRQPESMINGNIPRKKTPLADDVS